MNLYKKITLHAVSSPYFSEEADKKAFFGTQIEVIFKKIQLMKKTIPASVLLLLLITGCAASHKEIDDPVRAELLKPAKVETADTEQNLEAQSKKSEESKGIGYYLYVGTVAVLYTGTCILNEIVSGH